MLHREKEILIKTMTNSFNTSPRGKDKKKRAYGSGTNPNSHKHGLFKVGHGRLRSAESYANPITRKKISEATKNRPKRVGWKHSKATRKKLREQKLGKKNPSWKGGITPLYKQISGNIKYRQWRSDIFERDDYTCQNCGKRGGIIQAHHIKSFASIIKENKITTLDQALSCEELWNINNGKTLCEDCHKKTDTYGQHN